MVALICDAFTLCGMRISQFIVSLLWPAGDVPSLFKPIMWVGRYIYVLATDVSSGQISLRATSLVYTTLMALVPLIAVGFSVLKAFGVHTNQLEPMMLQFLEPLGAQGNQITQQIVGFIDKVNINVLGVVGVLFLVYSSISLIHKMEASFNHVWRVPHQRNLGRRITDYFTAILVGPSMVFVALALSASILGATVLQDASEYALVAQSVSAIKKAMPYLIIIGAFTFFYMFIPNTRVKLIPALIAGMVSGVLWQSAGWMFGTFVVSSKSSATYAIYSGFAILILFMLWIYIGWLILLLGGSLAFYIQNPQNVIPNRKIQSVSPKRIKEIGLDAMIFIAKQFYSANKPPSASGIAQHFNVRASYLMPVLDQLVASGYVHKSQSKYESEYALIKPAEQIMISDLIKDLEDTGDIKMPHHIKLTPQSHHMEVQSEWVLETLKKASNQAFDGVSLADVLHKDI